MPKRHPAGSSSSESGKRPSPVSENSAMSTHQWTVNTDFGGQHRADRFTQVFDPRNGLPEPITDHNRHSPQEPFMWTTDTPFTTSNTAPSDVTMQLTYANVPVPVPRLSPTELQPQIVAEGVPHHTPQTSPPHDLSSFNNSWSGIPASNETKWLESVVRTR